MTTGLRAMATTGVSKRAAAADCNVIVRVFSLYARQLINCCA